MAGYQGFSKSNNAINAENRGLMTATKLARKLKCKTGAIKALLHPAEWHHTSSHYNQTNYYNEPELIAVAELHGNLFNASDETVEAHDLLQKLRAWKPNPAETFDNCTVEYLTWTGSRNHPVATEHKHTGITVTRKGAFYTFHLPAGPVRKKIGSNGTYVRDAKGYLLDY